MLILGFLLRSLSLELFLGEPGCVRFHLIEVELLNSRLWIVAYFAANLVESATRAGINRAVSGQIATIDHRR